MFDKKNKLQYRGSDYFLHFNEHNGDKCNHLLVNWFAFMECIDCMYSHTWVCNCFTEAIEKVCQKWQTFLN